MSRVRRFKWEDLPESEQQQYIETVLPDAGPPPPPPDRRRTPPKRDTFTLADHNMDDAVDWVRKWNQDSLRFLRGVLRTEPARMPRVFKVRPGDGGQGWLDLLTMDGVSIYWHPGETLKYVHLGEFEKVVTWGQFDRHRQDLSEEDVAKLGVLGWRIE